MKSEYRCVVDDCLDIIEVISRQRVCFSTNDELFCIVGNLGCFWYTLVGWRRGCVCQIRRSNTGDTTNTPTTAAPSTASGAQIDRVRV